MCFPQVWHNDGRAAACRTACSAFSQGPAWDHLSCCLQGGPAVEEWWKVGLQVALFVQILRKPLPAGCPVLRERHALAAGGPGCDAERGGRCCARRQRPRQRACLHPAPLREHHAHHAGAHGSAGRFQVQLSCCLCWPTFCATHRSPCSLYGPAQSRQEALHVQPPAAWAQQDGGWSILNLLTQSAPEVGAPCTLCRSRAHHVCHQSDKQYVYRVASVTEISCT